MSSKMAVTAAISLAKGRRVLERGRELRLSALESLLERATAAEVEVVWEAARILEDVLSA